MRETLEKVQGDVGAFLEALDFIGPGKPYPDNMPPTVIELVTGFNMSSGCVISFLNVRRD